MTAQLEHVNFTASDPQATAEMLGRVFGWHIRWQGEAIHGGQSIHVGSEDSYVAIYSPGKDLVAKPDSYGTVAGLNHVAVTVDDLDAVEARVEAEGLTPHSHASYEPGRRFYFHDRDGIEWEVVQYD